MVRPPVPLVCGRRAGGRRRGTADRCARPPACGHGGSAVGPAANQSAEALFELDTLLIPEGLNQIYW